MVADTIIDGPELGLGLYELNLSTIIKIVLGDYHFLWKGSQIYKKSTTKKLPFWQQKHYEHSPPINLPPKQAKLY